MPQRNAQSLTLSDGVKRHTAVESQAASSLVDIGPAVNACFKVGTLCPQEVAIVAFNETHLHRLSLPRNEFETFLLQIVPHLVFMKSAKGEEAALQGAFWHTPKEIRLILTRIVTR